jgi:phenylacetaldehyde dehydrogenase
MPMINLAEQIKDDEEAVAVAKDTSYGLVNYVVSRNAGRAYAVADRLESGVMSINTSQSAGNAIEEMPLGGRKLSGYGRTDGRSIRSGGLSRSR